MLNYNPKNICVKYTYFSEKNNYMCQRHSCIFCDCSKICSHDFCFTCGCVSL